MKNLLLIAAIFALPLASHAGIYKCQVGGKTVFRDTPCSGGKGQELNVQSSPGVTPVAAPDAQQSDLDRTEAWLNSAQKDREKRSLDRQISDAEVDRDQLQEKMDAELAGLQDKKKYANNNLAGAAWEQSISTEMQAVTAKYDSKLRAADSRITELKQQRAKYGD